MLFRKSIEKFSVLLLGLVIVACGLPVSLPLGDDQSEASLAPTRTPLPTFTPTVITQVSLLPTPTSTLPPPATNTPLPPPPEPTSTPQPQPTATNTPAPAPTQPPPPPQPQPEEPAEPPAQAEAPPPAEPGVGANGVIGKITFRDGRNTYSVGEKVFVNIEAALPGESGQKPFGVLGLTASTGQFQTSWSNGTIDGVFRHEDGLAFSAPGNHKLWLSICFSSLQECQGPDGNWERFEPGLDVIIQ